MLLIEYVKRFQANESINFQMQGSIWEDPITKLAELREIRYATLDKSNNVDIKTAKKTAKDKQMTVAFLMGGGKYLESMCIILSKLFMIGQELKQKFFPNISTTLHLPHYEDN